VGLGELCPHFEVTMHDNVAITARMTRQQALALLNALRAHYRLQLTEHWYDDRFRDVPLHQRHDRLLATYPILVAHKRLIDALQLSIRAAR
jgi:hypothetical protein